jgi:hypothetical protein
MPGQPPMTHRRGRHCPSLELQTAGFLWTGLAALSGSLTLRRVAELAVSKSWLALHRPRNLARLGRDRAIYSPCKSTFSELLRQHSTYRCTKRTYTKTFSEFFRNSTTCRSCFLLDPPPASVRIPSNAAALSNPTTHRSTNRRPFLSAVSRYVLANGYWLLAIGYWLLAIGYWLLATGSWPSTPFSPFVPLP